MAGDVSGGASGDASVGGRDGGGTGGGVAAGGGGGLRIAYGDDPDQFGEWRMPGAGRAPLATALLLHGGYYRSPYTLDLMTPMAADLADRGWAVFNVEYRRPDAHGWAATHADVHAALAALGGIESFVPDAPLVVIGHSAGGQLALQLAEEGASATPAPGAPALAAPAALAPPSAPAAPSPPSAPAAPSPPSAPAAPSPPSAPGAAAATSGAPRIDLAVSLAGVVDLTDSYRRRSSDGAVKMALGGSPRRQSAAYAAASPSLWTQRRTPWLLVQGSDDGPELVLPNRALAANAQLDHPELLEAPGDHFAVIDPAATIWHAAVARITELLASELLASELLASGRLARS
ncbi:alpha/beta hydrolase [Subtercola boreus]|uniref:alpha/beta hydrolase n=1 Tax=Subtercola boreus TaxID=120213 RepID=UPI0011C04143|nr:alpha/beta hydrolase [Subtercola boreus]